jgi:hypothetical protein
MIKFGDILHSLNNSKLDENDKYNNNEVSLFLKYFKNIFKDKMIIFARLGICNVCVFSVVPCMRFCIDNMNNIHIFHTCSNNLVRIENCHNCEDIDNINYFVNFLKNANIYDLYDFIQTNIFKNEMNDFIKEICNDSYFNIEWEIKIRDEYKLDIFMRW